MYKHIYLKVHSLTVAASVGEIAKDTQYQDFVNGIGGDFIPRVCETFGVWSPYALSILGCIADRTTVRNGLPRKFARRQLLQQLSVTLWRYNVKMILCQYSLTAEDKFPDFDIGYVKYVASNKYIGSS